MVGSLRSPARKMLFSPLSPLFPHSKPPDATYFPSASSRLIARRAVGAVNMALTAYSLMIFQKMPALGVPTGLPS